MKGPHWSLKRVMELAADDKLFLQRTKALDSFESPRAAYIFAQEAIEKLTQKDFAQSKEHTFDIMDIYGVRIEEKGWYLELYIDEAVWEVTVVSLHPLERPLKTRGGMVKP